MAITKEIISFIKDHRDDYNFEISSLQWPRKYKLNLYDTEVSCSIDGATFSGRGSDESFEVAVTKSFSELIEGYCVKYFGFENSNGLAVDYSKTRGQDSAFDEIVERDLFFSHFLTRIAMKRISLETDSILIKNIIRICELNNIKLNNYMMGNNSNAICVIASGNNCKVPFGGIIGTAYSKTAEAALESALIEVIRDVASILENGSNSIGKEEFLDLRDQSPIDHLRLGRDLNYYKTFEKEKNLEQVHNTEYLYDAKIEGIQLPEPFNTLSLRLYRATCENAQNLFFGTTKREKVNLERLKSFQAIQT